MLKSIVLVVCLSVTGFAAAKINYEENSVGANRAIPNRIVEKELNTMEAASVLQATYSGFYQIAGKPAKDNFDFKRVSAKKSFPDDRWAGLARSIAGQVSIPAPSTGSRVKPGATAYVAFYPGGIEGFNPSEVIQLQTSAGDNPNTLAVLVIEQKVSKGATRFTGFKPVPNVYFFELAM